MIDGNLHGSLAEGEFEDSDRIDSSISTSKQQKDIEPLEKTSHLLPVYSIL